MRTAVLDIGTNTVLLFIADIDGTSFTVIRDDHAIARLGEGVDRTHHISEDAYQRYIAVLREHKRTAEQLSCERIIAVATSAMRDAKNRDEIIRRTKQDTGIEIEILSGDEEAQWTYRGAIDGMSALSAEIAVVDIGGGSTEISFGTGKTFEHGISLDIGAVRITERFFHTNPVASVAEESARAYIRESLQSITMGLSSSARLVAVAGTPTTLAAMQHGLRTFDAARVHGYVLNRNAIETMMELMFNVSTATLLDQFPSINRSRADILPAGTLLLVEVMKHLRAEQITVSTQGLRYGIGIRSMRS